MVTPATTARRETDGGVIHAGHHQPVAAAFDDSGDIPSGTPLFRYEQNEVYAAPDGGCLHHTVTETNLREAVEAWTKQLTP